MELITIDVYASETGFTLTKPWSNFIDHVKINSDMNIWNGVDNVEAVKYSYDQVTIHLKKWHAIYDDSFQHIVFESENYKNLFLMKYG